MSVNCQKPINNITIDPSIRNVAHTQLVCPVIDCKQIINSNPYYIYKHLLDKHQSIAKFIGLYVERAKRHATICSYCVNKPPNYGYSAFLHYHCPICPHIYFSSEMLLESHVATMHTYTQTPSQTDYVSRPTPTPTPILTYANVPHIKRPYKHNREKLKTINITTKCLCFPTTNPTMSLPQIPTHIPLSPIMHPIIKPKLKHPKCYPSELSFESFQILVNFNTPPVKNMPLHYGPIQPPKTSKYYKKCLILNSTPDLFESLRYIKC